MPAQVADAVLIFSDGAQSQGHAAIVTYDHGGPDERITVQRAVPDLPWEILNQVPRWRGRDTGTWPVWAPKGTEGPLVP